MSSDLPSNSAVEAFWKTFSPRHQHNAVFPSPRRTKTNNLPAEILLIIFKLAHEHEFSEQDLCWSRPKSTFLSPSLFPYAVASVCSLWRDVMSLIPRVWTRFVVVVGSAAAFPPTAILSQLSWCRDHPIDLIVVSRGSAVNNHQESAQVLSVMKILVNPYIHRFHELCFDVTFSSSLPPFPNGFHGTASLLHYLKLDCREDDGASLNVVGPIASAEPQFPALIRLAIDGRNYYNGCCNNLRWMAKYSSLLDLAISHYAPLPNQSFSTSIFLLPIAMMPNLRSLGFNDLVLHPSSFPPEADMLSDPSHLQLQNILCFESISAIFETLGDTPNITINHCAIGNPGPGPFNYNGELTLRDMDRDQDLTPILCAWKGSILNVVNCPSFDDTVLDMMNDNDEPYEIGTYTSTCAKYAHSLYIRDCLNFSAGALRRFVTNRSGSLLTVHVSGRAPDIGDEDLTWLSESLDGFYYQPARS